MSCEVEMQVSKSDPAAPTKTAEQYGTSNAQDAPKDADSTSSSSSSSSSDDTSSNSSRATNGSKEIGTWVDQLKEHLTESYLNLLYIFVPIAFAAQYLGLSQPQLFAASFLGLVPLAAALGDFTEDLATHTNPSIGALINVTFGNATEVIVSIAALRAKQYELIKNSLIGSVLGNTLLVLGLSFVVGGRRYPVVKFNAAAARTYMSSLVFASFGFLIPTTFAALNNLSGDPHLSLSISREISILLAGTYALYIWFQLKTHASMFEGVGDDDDDDPEYSFGFALTAVGISAVLVSILSDYLVDTIQPFAEASHLSEYFIAFGLVAFIGDVAEHAGAIMMAARGKPNIALGIALGSSIQIGMFVLPMVTLAAWVLDHPLNLNINSFTLAALFAGVILAYSVVVNGEANYLTGVKMVVAYVILLIAFLNAPDPGDPVRLALVGASAAPLSLSPAPTVDPWANIGSLVPSRTSLPASFQL